MPVPKPAREIKRTAEALRRLKVKPEQLATAPQITPMFKNADGGLATVLGAMRFAAQDEVIAAFLKKYDSIPAGDRERVPWEAVALAAKLDMHQLTGAILFALQAASVNTVKIIAYSNHPAVMQKTIEYAKLPSGDRDRTIVHRGLGFLPDPKGPVFIGKAEFGASGSKGTAEPAPTFSGDDDLDQIFPPADAMQEMLVPIRQRRLESGGGG